MTLEVFTDRLHVCYPQADFRSIRGRVVEFLDSLGCSTAYDKPHECSGLWRHADGGTLRASSVRNAWAMLQVSGALLATLRAADLLRSFLGTLGSEPGNVTLMDVTADVHTDAPPVVADVYRRATSGEGIRLTRKRTPISEVTRFSGLNAAGVETGTVYIGARRARVRLKVYDKQHEMAQNHGVSGPPRVRYEFTIKDQAMSLRDAYEPAGLFWSYMANTGLLPVPSPMPERSPAPLERVEADHAGLLSPEDRLRRRVAFSDELRALARLADSLPEGRALLHRLIDWEIPRTVS